MYYLACLEKMDNPTGVDTRAIVQQKQTVTLS